MSETKPHHSTATDSSEPPIQVCFVALDAYPAIDSRVEGGIGGIETRSWMLARSLAQSDAFDVSFIIRHHEAVSQTEYEGVTLLPVIDRHYQLRTDLSRNVRRTSHFPFLSIRHFSCRMLWQLPLLAVNQLTRPRTHSRDLRPLDIYTTVDTDLLACFGVNAVSASVIASAKASGKKSVLFIASDIDLDERYTADSEDLNLYHTPAKTCHFAVTNADRVVVQTSKQLELLERNFGRSGEILENPIDLKEWDERFETSPVPAEIGSLTDYVLWVGRAERNQKQPQLMPELACMCPETPFLMIMNSSDEELERQVRAEAPSNLRIVDKIPFAQMPALYRNASLLVNTSSSEGFPNTFLQAAASGVPIASLSVGEEFLHASHSGTTAEGSLEQLGEFVRQLPETPDDVNIPQARAYVEEHHSLDSRVDKLIQILRQCVGN
ncbi:MAG: glycosyltransferase [Planctomycetaceae bacterium]|nr:glycosyltransferase [Planctomycetaceae bacterium]